MEEKMDIVHESIAAEPLDDENNSISLKELSQSIEEVVSTPEIFFFFTPPFDQGEFTEVNNEYNSKINNDIYNEIMNSKVAFMCSENNFNMKASSLIFDNNTDFDTTQNSEIDTKSLPDNNYYNYFNTKLKMNDNDKEMSLNKYKIKKARFKGCMSIDIPVKRQQNVIGECHQNLSTLIQMYCYKCKIVTMNFIDRKCHICEKPLLFKCKNCSSIYKKLIVIRNHIKYECYKKRVLFKCAECDFKSLSKIQLCKHIKYEHVVDPQKSFECLECHRKYKVESSMLAHEKICTQGMTINCKYCTFKTKFINNLIVHMQSKHSQLSAGKKHKCSDCGKKLKNENSLNRHIKNLCGEKSKLKCEHCDYKINRKYYLAKHMQQEHPRLFIQNKFL